jgi:IMP dehydrogenase
MDEQLEFDDVLIKPIPSDVSSRDEVDIGVDLPSNTSGAKGEHLDFPLIASPMVGVVDGAFAKALSDLGGLAIFHRFYDTQQDMINDMLNHMDIFNDLFGLSVRVGGNYKALLEYNPNIILVDTANGYTKAVYDFCEEIANYIINNGHVSTLLMAGNVATRCGCARLYNAGCKLIRVGIGGGSPCSTRNVTGIGVPSVSMLEECSTSSGAYDFAHCTIVMDGGIKNSGDFVKAIVAGADLGMAGRLFGETYEAPNKGKLYGMASRTHMKNTNTEIKSVEGFDIEFEKKHSLEQFVREFSYGIKSAGTYLNAKNLEQIYVHGEFIKVTNSAIKKGI